MGARRFVGVFLIVNGALERREPGDLLAPAYAVFLVLQMLALLAKIAWVKAVGVSAGPALVIIPVLLAGAVTAAVLALRPHRGDGDRSVEGDSVSPANDGVRRARLG